MYSNPQIFKYFAMCCGYWTIFSKFLVEVSDNAFFYIFLNEW